MAMVATSTVRVEEGVVRRTNLSLYYLAGYLVPAGLLLLFIPEFATKLLLSNRTYGDYAPFHLAGVLLLVIGILIIQIIRDRLEMLYSTTLVARALISATLLWLFLTTGDPFFAVILVIVLVGVALTGYSYLLDRRDRARG
jgi:predicted MFS family arabinose efflux permease